MKIKALKSNLRLFDVICAIVGIAGVLLGMIEVSHFYTLLQLKHEIFFNGPSGDTNRQYEMTKLSIILRSVVTLSTIVLSKSLSY